MFTLIFVALFLVAWLTLSFLPWLVLSVATRGNAGLANLPLCLFTGLGMDGSAGIWVSMVAAFVAPSLLLAIRRFSLHPVAQVQTLPREGGHE
ncbi:MAG TPA: hypothetical protein PJ994_05600 [Tepidiformaceae bacterium]|nr:hypothetical protein [Tepidiformaceae bacterium]